jgi:ribosomal protein S24E
MVEYFWFETGTISEQKIENELKFHRDMNNSRYMIDNLSMNAGDEIKIHYWIFYDGDTEIQTIELKDVD